LAPGSVHKFENSSSKPCERLWLPHDGSIVCLRQLEGHVLSRMPLAKGRPNFGHSRMIKHQDAPGIESLEYHQRVLVTPIPTKANQGLVDPAALRSLLEPAIRTGSSIGSSCRELLSARGSFAGCSTLSGPSGRTSSGQGPGRGGRPHSAARLLREAIPGRGLELLAVHTAQIRISPTHGKRASIRVVVADNEQESEVPRDLRAGEGSGLVQEPLNSSRGGIGNATPSDRLYGLLVELSSSVRSDAVDVPLVDASRDNRGRDPQPHPHRTSEKPAAQGRLLEAAGGIEPPYEALQAPA
jgi:hypothetical protein